MLLQQGLRAVADGRLVDISGTKLSVPELRDELYETAAAPLPESAALLADACNLAEEKWDWALRPEMPRESFASSKFDIAGTWRWLQTLK